MSCHLAKKIVPFLLANVERVVGFPGIHALLNNVVQPLIPLNATLKFLPLGLLAHEEALMFTKESTEAQALLFVAQDGAALFRRAAVFFCSG